VVKALQAVRRLKRQEQSAGKAQETPGRGDRPSTTPRDLRGTPEKLEERLHVRILEAGERIARDYPAGLMDDLERWDPVKWNRIEEAEERMDAALRRGDYVGAWAACDTWEAVWLEAIRAHAVDNTNNGTKGSI